MTLRELMLKSPVCNGAKFARGLESTYRDMWRRYCRNDAPAIRHMESLRDQPPLSNEIMVRFSEQKTRIDSEQNHQTQSQTNGVTANHTPSLKKSSYEANGN